MTSDTTLSPLDQALHAAITAERDYLVPNSEPQLHTLLARELKDVPPPQIHGAVRAALAGSHSHFVRIDAPEIFQRKRNEESLRSISENWKKAQGQSFGLTPVGK